MSDTAKASMAGNEGVPTSVAIEIEHWMRAGSDRVLLVDAGGVLFNNVIEDSSFLAKVAATCNADADMLRRLYEADDERFETNRVGVDDVLRTCLTALGVTTLNARDFRAIDRLYLESVQPNVSLFAFLRDVRVMGLTLVLANNEAKRWEQLKHQAFRHLDLFDVVASSWRVGAVKPAAGYFACLDDLLYPTQRSRWRLLDDKLANVSGAHAAGIAATWYPTFAGRERE
jgi:putative hydrolase of the HAD superfamily